MKSQDTPQKGASGPSKKIANVCPIYAEAGLPDAPGVYFFKDVNGNILYIGRATSLRDRVKSYFGNDLFDTRGQLLVDMMVMAHKIEYQETDSVLEAIILESNLIKKHQPYYNTQEKDNKSDNYVIITDEEFPRVILVRGRTLELLDEELRKFKIKYQFGPYPQGALLKEALRIIRKIFPFRDAKSSIPYQESFYRSLRLSPATDSPEAKKDYQKTIRNLVLFFQGKKKELIKTLEDEMVAYAKNKEFEKAEQVKRTLYAIAHIQDVALIKKGYNLPHEHRTQSLRIEAYDIAHMSGKSTVGAMTVAYVSGNESEFEKNEYRKFKISKDANNDVAGLKEVLIRRFNHPEWQIPNLIVIDGGVGQINAAKKILDELGRDVPVVSVVKNDAHKADHLLSDGKAADDLIKAHSDIIIKLNAECHRFAIAYHKKVRGRSFLRTFLKPKY